MRKTTSLQVGKREGDTHTYTADKPKDNRHGREAIKKSSFVISLFVGKKKKGGKEGESIIMEGILLILMQCI